MKRFYTIIFTRVFLAIVVAVAMGALKWKYFKWSGIQVHFLTTPFYSALLVLVVLLLALVLRPELHPTANNMLAFLPALLFVRGGGFDIRRTLSLR